MKCADCKFWKSLDGTSDPFSEGFGDCRRRAPSPGPESAALILNALLGCGDLSQLSGREDKFTGFSERRAVWPSTFADEGCGEYEPRQSRQSFV